MRYLIFIFCLLSLESFGQIRDYNIVVNPLSKDDPYILSSDTSGTYRGRAQFHTIQYTANLLKPYLGCIDTAFVRNDSLFIYTTDLDSIAFAGGAGLTDGDKGDITVSGSGSNWQIDALAVDDNELQLTGVVAGQYNYPAVLKVNSKGRVTEVVAGSAPLDTFSYLATQSDISGFLSSVSHDNTLTGNGTVATPLKVDSSKIATQYDISGFLSSESQGIDDVLAIGQNLSADRDLDLNSHILRLGINDVQVRINEVDTTFSITEPDGNLDSFNIKTHKSIAYFNNNSNNFKVGINNPSPTVTFDVTGDGRFTGNLGASNLSGTNTGDQDLSGLLLKSDTAAMLAHFLERGSNLSDVATPNTALNNLLPTQTGHSGEVLTTNGTNTSWAAGGGYTDEQAQDAVGAMVNTSLTYVDGTPSLALTSRNINGTAFNGTANISIPASGKTFTWDGNGGIPAVGSTIYWIVPTACTISGWSIWATGASPTCTIDVWRVATGTTLPVVGNSIMGTKPALSTGNAVRSTTLTGWNPVALSQGDIIGVNIDAVTVTTLMSFQLEFN